MLFLALAVDVYGLLALTFISIIILFTLEKFVDSLSVSNKYEQDTVTF